MARRSRRAEGTEPARRAHAEAQGGGPRAPGRSAFPFPLPWEPGAGGGGSLCPPHPPRPPGAQKLGLRPLPPRLFPAQPVSRQSRLPIRLQSTSQPRPGQPRGRAEAGRGRAAPGAEWGQTARAGGAARCTPSSLPRCAGGSARSRVPPTAPGLART